MNTQVSPPPLPSHVQVATEPSVVARAPELLGKAAWRFRWQLAPVVGSGGVLTCGQAWPALTGIGLATVAGGAYRLAKSEVRFRDRMWLSASERMSLAMWSAAGSSWSLLMFVNMPGKPAAVLLASAQAYPSWRWAKSRMPKRRKISNQARALMNTWNLMIAVHGPDPVKGSLVIKSSVLEPAPGAVVFSVQLRPQMHAQTASSDLVRRDIEATLGMPVDTVKLSTDRGNSTRLRVSISPSRHLETSSVPWLGPEMRGMSVTLAGALDGGRVDVPIADEDGVRHALVSGTSGAGKSRVLRALVLPEPAAGLGVLVLVDGGGGTSCPELEPAAKIYATKPHEWKAAVRAVYAAYLERRERRGEARLTRFVLGQDSDPALTLAFDEAGAVGKVLSQTEHAMVLEMEQQGRKLGVRVIQSVQDPMADEIIGGRKARALLGGNGIVVALRAGDAMSSRITLSSTSAPIDLTALPEAPGSAWILERGRVLTGNPVRCVDAHEQAAGAAASSVTVISLHEDDEAALMAAWAKGSAPPPASDGETEPSTQEVRESDTVLLAILAEGPRTLKEIGGGDDGNGRDERWTWSRKTAARSLVRMSGEGRVFKDGDKWALVPEEPGMHERYVITAGDGHGGTTQEVIDAAEVERLARDLMTPVDGEGEVGITLETAMAMLVSSGTIRPVVVPDDAAELDAS